MIKLFHATSWFDKGSEMIGTNQLEINKIRVQICETGQLLQMAPSKLRYKQSYEYTQIDQQTKVNNNMESGTLLHIALLRKTSNAKSKHPSSMYTKRQLPHSRKKSNLNHKYIEEFQSKSKDHGDENFILSGWSTEENELKIHLKQTKHKNLMKLRQSFQQQNNNNLATSRTNIYSSEYKNRSHPRSNSFRKSVPHNRSTNESKLNPFQQIPHLKEFNSQTCMRAQAKFNKINLMIYETETDIHKQNQSVPELARINRKSAIMEQQRDRQRKQMKDKRVGLQNAENELGGEGSGNNLHSFNNFVNFNNVRIRKFFKF